MKITKPQQSSIDQLASRGGAALASEWTNGSGRYVTKRAIPPTAARFERKEYSVSPAAAKALFDAHPRALAVVAIVEV
jgi:hypothetical protein